MKNISKYWLCQIVGWGSNIAISLFFVFTLGRYQGVYVLSLVLTCAAGLLITHLMRIHIHKLKVMSMRIKRQVIYFIVLTVLYAIVFGVASEFIDYAVGYMPSEKMQSYSRGVRILLSTFNGLWVLLIWNFIYFLYHYVETNRKQELNNLKLEATVKSLELKTIKSHINPHFIFNALNSIRALVDENPVRARRAITELSNILRSSMSAEKEETVPLKQELNLVSDYLQLEQMRFEERLKVEMNVEEDTLQHPFPPMMLQMLVENGIKHGISKQIKGGVIKIQAKYIADKLQLTVTNTGILQHNGRSVQEGGFGLKSTTDRLHLLYNDEARFEIKELKEGEVESTIIIPRTTPINS